MQDMKTVFKEASQSQDTDPTLLAQGNENMMHCIASILASSSNDAKTDAKENATTKQTIVSIPLIAF